jgi:glycogen operon protein
MSTATESKGDQPLLVPKVGHSLPIGATLVNGGANFSVFSRSAASVELLLFDRVDDALPSRMIPMDPSGNRTYHYWHVYVPGLQEGQIYGFRAFGRFDPARGLRFDPPKLLIDPYGRAISVPRTYSREAARLEGDNAATAMKSVLVDPQAYDWEGDVPLNRPWARTIIYEMHVRGFTAHPSSGVSESKRGTYAGLTEKIPYLQQLGITAVELLPVFQFDPQDAPLGRTNYWGYSPVSFFAPHQAYSSCQEPLAALDEFRDMVKSYSITPQRVDMTGLHNASAAWTIQRTTSCVRTVHAMRTSAARETPLMRTIRSQDA